MQKTVDSVMERPEDRAARIRGDGDRRQAHLLWAVAAAQCQLLLNTDFPRALQAALRSLGRTLELDRAFVAHHREGEPPRLEVVAHWLAPHVGQAGGPRAGASLERHALFLQYTDWAPGLAAGRAIRASHPSNPVDAAVKSYLFVPILVGGRYWGVIGLEHFVKSVQWTTNDESILQSLSLGIGGAIEKQQGLETLTADHVPASWSDGDGAYPSVLESQILSQVSEAILAIDRQGLVTYFNQGAEIIFGLSAREAIGEPYESLVRQRNTPFEKDAAVQADLERKGVWTGRDTLVLKDWRTRQVTLSVTPLREQGQVLGAIVVLRDVLRDVTANRQQELRIEHRMRVESALVEASQQLVSGGAVNFEQLLGLMGEAVGAETVYFVEIPSDKQLLQASPAALHELSQPRIWEKSSADTGPLPVFDFGPGANVEAQRLVCKWNGTRLSRASKQGTQTALAVPVLSPHGKLHGYLGVEYGGRPPEWREADSRVLSVLGDLLSTYFERKISEEALRESEERYRTFVDTTSEAIWRIELEQPVSTLRSISLQVAAFCEQADLAECNRVMAVLLGSRHTETVLGRRLNVVMPHLEVALVEEFVRSGYRLHNHEYSVACVGKAMRHFVINAVGTVKNDTLIRVWGSCVEVTERVMLERQMVEALEEQQQRIGRDLHDGVGQLLTGVRMLSQNLAEKLAAQEDESAVQARKVSGFAEQASRRVREIYRGLTPTQLFYEGLATALNELAHNTTGLPGITCTFMTDGVVDVWEKDTKMHLYRVAQEAVNNALKHAEASQILIALNARGNEIMLSVEDNGKGFDPSVRTGKSLGLNSMDYRARTIKGALEITSAAGEGTRVRCVIKENLLRHELTQFA
ncbi:MAG: GAF domain-containing protein [Rhodothermales bacterium]|nr:GAF domain-containing protein [Rhodothermales bacterium]